MDNGYYTRSYKKALSTLPGTVVTAPEVKGDGVFLGWSLDGETVSYKSGEEITMPIPILSSMEYSHQVSASMMKSLETTLI